MSARNKKTALIAMSGGVDSSVAAWLMQLLKGSPELAEHLLQMTQLLRAKE